MALVQIQLDTNNPDDNAFLQRLFASTQSSKNESSTTSAASNPSASAEPSEDSCKDSKPAKKPRKSRKSKSPAKTAEPSSAPESSDQESARPASTGEGDAPSQEEARKAMLACAKATNDKDFTLGLIEKYAGEGKRALKHVPDDKLADLIQEFELAVAENS